MICFVVPVPGAARSADPGALSRLLRRTVLSVRNQVCPEWRLLLVAGEGIGDFGLGEVADDDRIQRVVRPFAFGGPVTLHDRYFECTKARTLARRDKGRKSLWGTRLAVVGGATHVMMLDSDDLVSSRLAGWCHEHPDAAGWWIERGWIWTEGNRWLVESVDHSFSSLCGSSNIVHARFFGDDVLARSFDDPSIEECGWWLPHGHIPARIMGFDGGYSPLPFRGAVYVRHGHNISPSWSGWARTLVRKMLRSRLLSSSFRGEFFGRPPHP